MQHLKWIFEAPVSGTLTGSSGALTSESIRMKRLPNIHANTVPVWMCRKFRMTLPGHKILDGILDSRWYHRTTIEDMAKKKQTGIRLSDEDLALLELLQAELSEEGVRVTKSDIVALGLRQIKEQGGLKKVLTKKREKKV